MTVCVIGCGRVGLPLALALVEAGIEVCGVDPDRHIRDAVNIKKQMPFNEPGFDEILALGKLQIHETIDWVPEDVDRYIVAVGFSLGEHLEVDMGPLLQVAREIGERLKQDDLIVIRSTLPPGGGKRVKRELEREAIAAGANFCFAYCPERLAEGAAKRELKTLPQLIGADDTKSLDRALDLFGCFGPCKICSIREAELAKLFCNAARYAEFAVANELFLLAAVMGCDPHRIFALANEGYPRPITAKPGLTGGLCLRKDWAFLTEGLSGNPLFLAAWRRHENMPQFLIDSAAAARGVTSLVGYGVGVLGLAYKRDSDDARDSLAVKLCKLLERQGALLQVHDPFVGHVPGLPYARVSDPVELFEECDIVFIAVNHTQYSEQAELYLTAAFDGGKGCLIVDIWNALGRGAYVT